MIFVQNFLRYESFSFGDCCVKKGLMYLADFIEKFYAVVRFVEL